MSNSRTKSLIQQMGEQQERMNYSCSKYLPSQIKQPINDPLIRQFYYYKPSSASDKQQTKSGSTQCICSLYARGAAGKLEGLAKDIIGPEPNYQITFDAAELAVALCNIAHPPAFEFLVIRQQQRSFAILFIILENTLKLFPLQPHIAEILIIKRPFNLLYVFIPQNSLTIKQPVLPEALIGYLFIVVVQFSKTIYLVFLPLSIIKNPVIVVILASSFLFAAPHAALISVSSIVVKLHHPDHTILLFRLITIGVSFEQALVDYSLLGIILQAYVILFLLVLLDLIDFQVARGVLFDELVGVFLHVQLIDFLLVGLLLVGNVYLVLLHDGVGKLVVHFAQLFWQVV